MSSGFKLVDIETPSWTLALQPSHIHVFEPDVTRIVEMLVRDIWNVQI